MKPLTISLGISLVACALFVQGAPGRAQQQNNTPLAYTGEITDSACAAFGSHSQTMSRDGSKTTKDCVLECVKNGAKFVLYIADTKTTYNLDDQEKAQDYAAEKVTIVGTYDGPTKTIHITSITAAP